MNKFSWYEAVSVSDALKHVNATASDILGKRNSPASAVFKAGGIDLLDLMKEGLVNPATIISVKSIPGLGAIEFTENAGLKIGANVTLAELEENSTIKSRYLALHQAVAHAGTPQLRNSATVGGNLAQRTRCWYFRSIEHECFRKGSGTCFAQKGENEFHAVMNNQTCASVHSSSVSTSLLAFNAKVVIASADGKSKEVDIDKFFVHPDESSKNETILQANELITHILVPTPKAGTKSCYIKQGARESHDWAIADVAVVAHLTGTAITHAEIALGAAAPVPVKAREAAKRIIGKPISESVAKAAGEESMRTATPMSGNAYKIPVFKAIVKRAVMNLA